MRYHRFDFPDLPLEAFKHYGDRRIKPQSGSGGIIETITSPITSVVENVTGNFGGGSGGGGGGGGGGIFGGLGSFLGNPLGTVVDTASNIINGASDTLAQVGQGVSDIVADVGEGVSDTLANVGEGVSDAIHDVGTAIAKDKVLSTAAVIVLSKYIGPQAAAALVSANAGAKPEIIVQNMILAGVAADVAQSVAPEVAQMTGSGNVGAVAGQAAGSATTAALTGRDPIQAALDAAISGGVTAGTSEVLGQVEGYSDLTPTQQRAVSAAVSAELQGKDPTAALIRGAINIGREKVQDEIKYAKYDEMDFGVNQGAVDRVAAEQAQNDFYESIGINPDTVKDTAPATTDVVDQLVNSGAQETPPTVEDIATIGGQPVTTSPGEEPLADLSKSGVIMPDGSYKTWAELDELAGVPPGTIYTDGGTTITEQELQDILKGTYTPRGTTPKPTTPKPTTPKPTTPAPTTPVAQQQPNPLGMLALLDVLGQQPQQQPAMQDPYAKIKSFQGDLFGEDISTDFLGAATGGSVDDLLRLLRS